MCPSWCYELESGERVFIQESEAFFALTCGGFPQQLTLRFMNTIVGCQKIKLKLNASSDTCIQKWMWKVYHSFVAILPFYFESVGLDIMSRHGFQESSFRSKPEENKHDANQDLEAKLEEFLRFEERSGTPLAIALVADVAAFHMLRSASNHSALIIGKEKSLKANRRKLEPDDILSAYPVVYMRTTADHDLSSKILGSRRNVDNDLTSEKDRFKGVNARKEMISWPFTSWSNIIPVLKNTLSLIAETDSVEVNWSQVDSETSIYASSVNNSMWFVAMKRKSDDNRWNRRNDEERTRKEKQFLTEFSSCLRLVDVFKSNVKTGKDDVNRLSNELSRTLSGDRLFDNDDKSQLLESFRRIFGLRSPHTFPFRKQNTTMSPEFFNGLNTWSSTCPGHYAFFLGSPLMDSLDE
jgi:hypothetical protein